MSSPIWTRAALSPELRHWRGTGWRLVEAQHRVSTLKLVDSLAEQDVLENLIEGSKTAIPPECQHLDYLLATPFRYGTIYPGGSRFRRAGRTAGVFYCARTQETAVAEMAFYRLLFFAESPLTPLPANAAEYTAFSAHLKTKAALDLTSPPLNRDQPVWTSVNQYEACQTLAGEARAAHCEIIRYESVRDPQHGTNIAVLSCSAFAEPQPVERRTWRIRLSTNGIQALCEFPIIRLEFGLSTFAQDARLTHLAARG
jgi:hypothetical protein